MISRELYRDLRAARFEVATKEKATTAATDRASNKQIALERATDALATQVRRISTQGSVSAHRTELRAAEALLAGVRADPGYIGATRALQKAQDDLARFAAGHVNHDDARIALGNPFSLARQNPTMLPTGALPGTPAQAIGWSVAKGLGWSLGEQALLAIGAGVVGYAGLPAYSPQDSARRAWGWAGIGSASVGALIGAVVPSRMKTGAWEDYIAQQYDLTSPSERLHIGAATSAMIASYCAGVNAAIGLGTALGVGSNGKAAAVVGTIAAGGATLAAWAPHLPPSVRAVSSTGGRVVVALSLGIGVGIYYGLREPLRGDDHSDATLESAAIFPAIIGIVGAIVALLNFTSARRSLPALRDDINNDMTTKEKKGLDDAEAAAKQAPALQRHKEAEDRVKEAEAALTSALHIWNAGEPEEMAQQTRLEQNVQALTTAHAEAHKQQAMAQGALDAARARLQDPRFAPYTALP